MEYQDKAKLVMYFERIQELINSLGICMFFGTWEGPDLIGFGEIAELYSAATGWKTTEEELIKIADRILNTEKAFNTIHVGFERTDDYPPRRYMEEPVSCGPYAGYKCDKDKWDEMLDKFYELHGWDKATGLQTCKCLTELGIKDIAQKLKKAGKLIDNNPEKIS